MSPYNENNQIKASPYTSLFFIEYQLSTTRNDYHIVFDQVIKGKLDIPKLQKGLTRFIQEHIIFNSHLIEKEDGLYWEKNPKIYPLEIFKTTENQASFIKKPFDLTQGPLYRFGLFEINKLEYEIILVLHHAIIDGRNYNDFLERISNYYNNDKFTVGSSQTQIRSITLTYDLIEKRINNLLRKNHAASFWKQLLANLPYRNELPYINKQRKIKNKISSLAFEIDLSHFDALKERFPSIFNVLLLSWGVLIAKYSGIEEAHICYPIAIKECNALEYGAQINTLIMPIRFTQEESFFDLYSLTSEFINSTDKNEKIKYKYLPTKNILKACDIRASNIAFSQTNLKNTKIDLKKCHAEVKSQHNIDIAGADILLSYEAAGTGKYSFLLLYDTSIFNKKFIIELRNSYMHLLNECLNKPDKSLSKISSLSQKQVLSLYNLGRIKNNYQNSQTIHQCFEQQTKKNPNNIAIIYKDFQLTYNSLNETSNQLANHIRHQYAEFTKNVFTPDTLIILYFERSIEMIIAILAVLKAGGAYAPVSPEYPLERLRHILRDTNAKIILTQNTFIKKLQNIDTDFSVKVISAEKNTYSHECKRNLDAHSRSTDLAYIIYTSGTTGKPKGAMQTHDNVTRLFSATKNEFNFSSHDTWTLYHSYVFDFSVWELWGALLHGGKLIIPSFFQTKDIDQFYHLCADQKVTVLNQTPTAFYLFSEAASKRKCVGLSELRIIIFGGESLNIKQLKSWWTISKKQNLKTELINMYGITETTVHVTLKRLREHEPVNFNIGKTLSDLSSYIFDKHYNFVPKGVIGELYIGGAGLSRGYFNNPELTKKRFINIRGERLYKTGDLVRYSKNNDLEYIGRNDFQVKIRGYRIELGEIEKSISKIKGIKQSIVVAVKKQIDNLETYILVAYYVSNTVIEKNVFLQNLSQLLPDYMIPAHFIHLLKPSLTVNNKLDRKKLPTVDFDNYTDNYAPPRNEIESMFCLKWEKLFNLKRIGIYDDFFSLGGDSISCIQMVADFQNSGFHFTVPDVFKFRTIARLSLIRQTSSSQVTPSYHAYSLVNRGTILKELNLTPNSSIIEDVYPASYLQMGLLLENQLANLNGIYHTIFAYRLSNTFVSEKFFSIWEQLIKKHPLLRTSFSTHKTHSYCCIQYSNIHLKKKISVISINDLSDFINKEKSRSFHLSDPGLFKIYIYSISDKEFSFIFSSHHAIEDGWSVASLIAEFSTAYISNAPIIQEKLPSYGEFVAIERQALSNQVYKKFWGNYLKDLTPSAYTSTLKYIFSTQSQLNNSITLNKNLSQKIIAYSIEMKVSPDIIFMSAYALALTSYQDRNDILFGIVVNNRIEKTGGEKSFGLYLNTIPLRISLNTTLLRMKRKLIQKMSEEKALLYQYKRYPYGKIKSDLIFQNDIYSFAFNYIHFHIYENKISQKKLNTINEFEQTNIPFILQIVRRYNRFTMSAKNQSTLLNDSAANDLLHHIEYCLLQLIDESNPGITLHSSKRQKASKEIPLLKKQVKFQNAVNEKQKSINIGDRLQKKILSLWRELLNHDNITLDDTFFNAGGNSILLIALQARLEKLLHPIQVNLTDLFRYPTIRKYTFYLSKARGSIKNKPTAEN